MELKQDRLDAINDLIALGVPKAKIARKFDISRKRLYQILSEQSARTNERKK